MPLLAAICDRMYALELGGVIAEGTPAEVLDHPRVIESYLDTDAAAIHRSETTEPLTRLRTTVRTPTAPGTCRLSSAGCG